ncbi:hypothetical protein HK405_004561, partial [Cladochytrium tenue]
MDLKYEEVLLKAASGIAANNSGYNMSTFNGVLGVIAVAKESLHVDDLAALLGVEADRVRISILWLRGILDIVDGEIRVIHKSLVDYLLDEKRCKAAFHVKAAAMHMRLVERCLAILQDDLRYNICDVSHTIFLSQIPDMESRTRKYIPRLLRYAARFWVQHLSESSSELEPLLARPIKVESGVLHQVDKFCRHKLLQWYEDPGPVPSHSAKIARWMQNPFRSRRKAKTMNALPVPPTAPKQELTSSFGMILQDIMELARDGYRLIRDVYPAISPSNGSSVVSPLHIYHSALPFYPSETKLYRTYYPLVSEDARLPAVRNAPSVWGACETTLESHSGAVWGVAFSPDGDRVASAGDDGTLRIMDSETGEEIRRILAHEGPVGCLSWFDFSRVATGGDDGLVRLWDLDSGDDGGRVYLYKPNDLPQSAPVPPIASRPSHRGPTRATRCVRVSSNGKYVAASGKDGIVHVFNSHLEDLFQIRADHGGYAWSVDITPDSRYVVSAGEDGTIKMWDLGSGGLSQTFSGPHGSIWSVRISSDGQYMVGGGEGDVLYVWDLSSSSKFPTMRIHTREDAIMTVDVSTAGRKMVSGGQLGSVRLWNKDATGDPSVGEGTFMGRVMKVVLSRDGKTMVTSGDDGVVRVWDFERRVATMDLVRHIGSVDALAISQAGDTVLSGGHDGVVCVWGLTGPTPEKPTVFAGHKKAVRAVAFIEGGRGEAWIASAGHDTDVLLWTRTGAVCQRLRGHKSRVLSLLAVPPRGRGGGAASSPLRILSGSSDFELILWDANAGAPLRVFSEPEAAITSLALRDGGGGDLVAVGLANGVVYTLGLDADADGPPALRLFADGPKFAVRGIAFGTAGAAAEESVVTAAEDGTVRVWGLESQREAATFAHPAGCSARSVAVAAPGGGSGAAVVVSAHTDGRVYFWDTAGGGGGGGGTGDSGADGGGADGGDGDADTHEWRVQLESGVTLVLARSGWVHVERHDGARGVAVL